jgi:uncharacterized protein (DUF2141 family)
MLSTESYVRVDGASKGKIVVDMKGFRNDKGAARIALFRGSEGFPGKPEKAFAGASSAIRQGRAQAIFDAVPSGDYCIAVLHDDNMSNRMETNLLGIPKKGYGVSNNPRKLLRAPTFDDARVYVSQSELKVDVEMNYLL